MSPELQAMVDKVKQWEHNDITGPLGEPRFIQEFSRPPFYETANLYYGFSVVVVFRFLNTSPYKPGVEMAYASPISNMEAHFDQDWLDGNPDN